MTERLYYHDPYQARFEARVVDRSADGCTVYLDRSAFYPASGGQPSDRGSLSGVAVVDVVDEGERVAHVLAAPLGDGQVAGEVDWARRYDHMQQHTGQHLLSAVWEELYGIATVSFHMGAEESTIDLQVEAITREQMVAVERRVREQIARALPVLVAFEDAATVQGLRKASEREGVLRVVEIEGVDRSACGGTHVRTTAEIGMVAMRKVEKIRGIVRVVFLCGERAFQRARADYETLTEISRTLSAGIEETPAMVAALVGRASDAEKARRKLALELAVWEGQRLHAATAAGADGVRRVLNRVASGGIDDETRALAQSFTNGEKAVYLAAAVETGAVLLAASKDSGVHAGEVLKKALAAHSGRGGGNAQLAQGSVPKTALDDLVAALSN